MNLSCEEIRLIENFRTALEYDRKRLSKRVREAAEVAEILEKKGLLIGEKRQGTN